LQAGGIPLVDYSLLLTWYSCPFPVAFGSNHSLEFSCCGDKRATEGGLQLIK